MVDEDATGSKPGASAANGPAGDGLEEPFTEGGERAPSETTESASATDLAALKKELHAANERWMRERADLENLKKRVTREKADALRFGNEALLRDLLPVIDNLQRAIDHGAGAREVDPILEGVELVLRSLGDVLQRHGVKPVEALGRPFDPAQHEAIGHVPSDQPPNTVVGEHQRGYLLHDRLLRPAMVTVAKSPANWRSDVENADDDG